MPNARTAPAESIRHSLVALRRLFQRKELVELWESAFGRSSKMDYTELRLLDAVRVSQARGATVGEISRLLGVDPSRASRQVARAVSRGLVERHANQTDGRQVVLEVTRRGAALQERGSALTRARIEVSIEGWSRVERERFAKLFGEFVNGMVRRPMAGDAEEEVYGGHASQNSRAPRRAALR